MRAWPWRVLILAAAVGVLVDFDGTVLYLALPAIAADFHAPVAQLTQAASVLALGSILALPLGALADRRGRRFTLVLVTTGFAIGNLVSGLAPSLLLLAVARLFAVCFASAALGLALTIVIEASPARQRSLLVTAVSFGAGGGAGVTAILYPLLYPHWRYLYLLGGLGILLAGVLWRWLPESQVWRDAGHGDNPAGVLLRPEWRGRLALIGLSGFLSFIAFQPGGFFGALFATSELHFSPTLVSAVLFTSAPLAIPGYLLGGWLSDRKGRRVPGTVLWALAAVFAAITYAGRPTAFWIGNATWTFMDGAASPITGAWFGELFPTRARATAQAVGTVAAALGGIVGLQLVGQFAPSFGLGPTIVVLSAAAFIGALVLLALPETGGKALPD
ncbi:MAG: MFS transporter [Candidatus Dormibacteraeota bacterium]|nr:MFS transporter [Candidatus Dormibacteraeota bacterium]